MKHTGTWIIMVLFAAVFFVGGDMVGSIVSNRDISLYKDSTSYYRGRYDSVVKHSPIDTLTIIEKTERRPRYLPPIGSTSMIGYIGYEIHPLRLFDHGETNDTIHRLHYEYYDVPFRPVTLDSVLKLGGHLVQQRHARHRREFPNILEFKDNGSTFFCINHTGTISYSPQYFDCLTAEAFSKFPTNTQIWSNIEDSTIEIDSDHELIIKVGKDQVCYNPKFFCGTEGIKCFHINKKDTSTKLWRLGENISDLGIEFEIRPLGDARSMPKNNYDTSLPTMQYYKTPLLRGGSVHDTIIHH